MPRKVALHSSCTGSEFLLLPVRPMIVGGTHKRLDTFFANVFLRPHRQRMLKEAGTTDYRKLISAAIGLKVVTKWLMKLDVLSQYLLATQKPYQ